MARHSRQYRLYLLAGSQARLATDMHLRSNIILGALASILLQTCRADIGFSSPSAGQTISGSTIDVEFAEGSGSPSINDFTAYTLQLCAGGNTQTDYVIPRGKNFAILADITARLFSSRSPAQALSVPTHTLLKSRIWLWAPTPKMPTSSAR